MTRDHDETRQYYDAIAAGYNELHGEEQLVKYRRIAQELQLPADARVLDVGAGTGIGYAIIPSVGVDPSPELLKQHPHPQSVVARAESLPFPDQSFDAALCVTAIHHADHTQAIRELLRVSRGPIAITVLKKSPRAQAIVHDAQALLQPLRILEEDKDLILLHEPNHAR
jgi:ubiquinone/menaquinone biosynthesis C-methylase UbiE